MQILWVWFLSIPVLQGLTAYFDQMILQKSSDQNTQARGSVAVNQSSIIYNYPIPGCFHALVSYCHLHQRAMVVYQGFWRVCR